MADYLPVLRTVTVDDEPLARRLLRALLGELSGIELVAECRNGREAIDVTRSLAPDLLILDIQMPGMNGFDVIKALQADLMPCVVFCTAYQEYALDAFDLHAVDYVLKPVSRERLGRAIKRARRRIQETPAGGYKTPLIGAIDEIAGKAAQPPDHRGAVVPATDSQQRIAIKNHDGTVLIAMNDIDWIDAAGDYMCLHVKSETLIMRSTLKDLIERLDPARFKRIHRSTVVNLERIDKIVSLQKGEFMLELGGNQQLKVSRNFRKAISQFLEEH